VTEDMHDAVSRLLPLRVEEVDYNDPMVVLAGPHWSLSVACPWRLMRGDKLVTSYGDEGAGEILAGLVGNEVVALGPVASSRVLGDLQVSLGDGSVLDVFADTDLDPWVLRLPEHTFVGTVSCA
jgi:hypothetical protein